MTDRAPIINISPAPQRAPCPGTTGALTQRRGGSNVRPLRSFTDRQGLKALYSPVRTCRTVQAIKARQARQAQAACPDTALMRQKYKVSPCHTLLSRGRDRATPQHMTSQAALHYGLLAQGRKSYWHTAHIVKPHWEAAASDMQRAMMPQPYRGSKGELHTA